MKCQCGLTPLCGVDHEVNRDSLSLCSMAPGSPVSGSKPEEHAACWSKFSLNVRPPPGGSADDGLLRTWRGHNWSCSEGSFTEG
jgi:hypothetical protein